MNVLALIPARSGSKGIPHKNIRHFKGKPLIAHSIEHAQLASLVTRVVVSTDSAEYAEIARENGAETPFLRPIELAQDFSTDLETFQHALNWLTEHEGYTPDIVVHLRPTYPIRKPADIDAMIRILIDQPDIDSVRSVVIAPETPYKMWRRDERGMITPIIMSDIIEPYNQPRQALPMVYLQNACIDVTRTRVILEQNSMSGQRIFGYIMNENYDIDTEAQLNAVVAKFGSEPTHASTASSAPKTFCFDIDGVIAQITPQNQYDRAEPCWKIIGWINALYDHGHRIVLNTARGTMTGIDWSEVTRKQMDNWGVKYHALTFGKPAADYYIDDRAIMLDRLEALVSKYTSTSLYDSSTPKG